MAIRNRSAVEIWTTVAATTIIFLAAGTILFSVVAAPIWLTLDAGRQKPKLLLDWKAVYVTEQGVLSISPWNSPSNTQFPKKIYLGKSLDAQVEVWVEFPNGDQKTAVVTLGDLRYLIYIRARGRVEEGK